ncbi:choice-of-anchor I family protein [Alcanivorax sp. 1008]|uniref:choice-of-anchor I family protein n=1 Tax=Alcanivorax sp. 1008 TaxID=2816853 RepID=UPI001D2BC698|nr:choice-of-anchor I family protein [Alcanivorax sp. 1008]MCC1496004.1 choice-of-anchor I family protein [Alcanivorax sp. 1008]
MNLKYTLSALAIAASLSACGGDDGSNGTSATLLQLKVAGTYTPPGNPANFFDESAAEIVAYDARQHRLFVVNANDITVDVLDMSDPSMPSLMSTIDATAEGGVANSVAVSSKLVAVAIEANTKTDPGKVVFYNSTSFAKVGEATVGALPDMLAFTPDGNKVLVANEGEPNDDYSVDPEGSVSIIDITDGVDNLTVNTASFTSFNTQKTSLISSGVRIFGPGASVAQDLEPEYIAISEDGSTAWASLQENNAIAIIDIDNATVDSIVPLGFKDHRIFGNELDASNRDDRINIRNWPVFGMYQPDTIASYSFNGETYIVTANEGDARDYDTWSEEIRVKDMVLTDDIGAAGIQADEDLGRLNVTSTLGVSNGCDPSLLTTDPEVDCEYDALYAYGARSFSIRAADGTLVFDSGNDFERITAARNGEFFNSNNDENDFDSRSDDKGPEPEGLALGNINGQTFAFIGLERVGGIMVYNISNPQAPQFVQYINNRDFSGDPSLGTSGDLAPEGLTFVGAKQSPSGKPLLIVGNEVSGTTTVYEIDVIEL